MRRSVFSDLPGVWLKGNVHSHTTRSDGHLSPQQVVDAYRDHDYDWLVLTDHNRFTDPAELEAGGLVLLNGIELTTDWGPRIHANAFWAAGPAPYAADTPVSLADGEATVAELRRLREAGCYLTLNHPHWSLLEPGMAEDALFDALEAYNHSTALYDNMGLGTIYWDQMLRRGFRLNATAGDDNHNGAPPDSIGCDSFGGFTMVKAGARTAEAVLEALRRGDFYASAGPIIRDFFIEDGQVTLQCSPCPRLWICVDGRHYKSKTGRYLTRMQVPLPEGAHYLRAECLDAAGHSAYTNPLYMEV